MIESIRLLADRSGLALDELNGQVAVITGSGRGIGQAAAVAFALLGARVVIAELADTGEETVGLIRRAGGEAFHHRTDVADEASVVALAEAVRTTYGDASILVNNAILCPVVRLEAMDLALWDRVIGVNLRGAFLTTKAFLPQMRRRGGGTVINMVSTDAMPGLSAYIASKQGLVGLTQSLAVEVGQEGIRTIAFGPGMVSTPGLRSAGEGLAPILGITREQFLGLSLHPAYDGLMPPEHAGMATAYLAARLAAEYHGESVTGYTVLERAGVIQPGGVATDPATSAVSAQSTQIPAAADERSELLHLSGRLREIVAETAADFEKLPIFVRPLARSGFRSKAGETIQEWQRIAARLTAQVEAGEPVDRARYVALLEKLVKYLQGVPGETARFTRDQAFLQQVQERTARYEADLRALIQAL